MTERHEHGASDHRGVPAIGEHRHPHRDDGHGGARHGHDHDGLDYGEHGHGGVLHAVQSFLGLHSHEHAESIDSTLEASERGIRALKISFVGLMITAVIQAGIVVVTGSVALLADTIHNFSDALTAIPLFIAFRLGRRPATRRYTYGYRRAEDVAGLFIVAMILVSAVLAAWESVDRLLHPRTISYVGMVFAAGVVGFLGNEVVALYRIRIGRDIGSASLVADGLHARTDGLTSLAVAGGAVGVWLGFDLADPIIGIIVSIAIFGVLWSAARDILRRLMDAVDPELVDDVERVARGVPGVVAVGLCQARWLGHRLRIDIDIRVDATMTVTRGHAVGEAVRKQLLADVKHLDVVHVHVDGEAVENGQRARETWPSTVTSRRPLAY